ncbi:ATP-dependent DNA helicase [Microcella sp.]|uniref:ATP-dependent DNA helicase n=1 Tax=Microcella sp. TaxID=1913979 RepID=UPI002565EB26|nr:ATP-dependent DNA helicase [Microcella sp.]MBX9472856.1 ATP-dependent helicase [Microcella sp.]
MSESNRRAFSAVEIAEKLGQHRPTDEQRAIIEAPLGPALVVAGAGSGKTETMAARVLWLVANGHVAPDEVLGLTFTRKAAGELAARIRERLVQLGASGLLGAPFSPRSTDAAGAAEVSSASRALVDAFTQPTVATYNSFASSLYRDHAVLIGRDPDGVLLREASAWQLARELVTTARDDRLAELDLSVDKITQSVLQLAHAVAEHDADIADVRRVITDFLQVADLPLGDRYPRQSAFDALMKLGATLPIVDLVEQLQQVKHRDGYVEFADQVSLALSIVRRHASVAEQLRERYRVVLLDEYQDTNVAQTWLLAELFGGTPVMAVGDPHQSIYGWRGASASNLDDFAARFTGTDGEPVGRYSLSTSWRNGTVILQAANVIVEPIAARANQQSEPLNARGVAVETLRPSPVASSEPIDVAFEETLHDEARVVAAWLAERVAEPPLGAKPGAVDAEGRPLRASAALLMRNRATQPVFLAALREAKVPVHVLGIGGLLEQPEIADLVSALAVIDDPAAGTELVRLLAGPRWRIGVADLHALSRIASWLRDRDLAQRAFSDEVKARLRASVARTDGVSLVDALDFVATASDGHSQLAALSPAGLERLQNAGRLFATLRTRTALDLPDLVLTVEHELMLDIEVAANPSRTMGEAPREAFFEALDGYLALADHATLGGFLGWLREAEWRDNLSPRSEDPEPGTVQVLTIHGSKGLEWDHVVVPRLVVDELPSKPRDGTTGWLKLGVLPYELRGDAAELPVFAWRGAETRKELLQRREVFSEEVGAHLEREERRLAYVAVTRARHRLLLTGSWWAGQKSSRGPSPFLLPLEERGLIGVLPDQPQNADNPIVDDDSDDPWWPVDPFGARRASVVAAAERVRAADPSVRGDDRRGWQREIDLLLAERAERLAATGRVTVPLRVPASSFKDFITEPAEVAERLRRPMPQRPFRATRLGTVFHRWVEQRYGVGAQPDAVDGFDAEFDLATDGIDPQALDVLQATFERSEWAARTPVDVERELHLPFDGRILVCKLDAVYSTDPDFDPVRDRGSGRAPHSVEIVDWKTGKAPRDDADRAAKELQLALYRVAYARWAGLPLDAVTAAFYFVADDAVLRPPSLPDEAELRTFWRAAVG